MAPSPPPPPSCLFRPSYTKPAIQTRLAHANAILQTTHLPPLGQRMYHLYKAACEEILSTKSSPDSADAESQHLLTFNDALLSLIQKHDSDAPMMSCLRSHPSPEGRALRDEIPKLLRASLFARYKYLLLAACQSQPLPAVEWGELAGWALEPEVAEYWIPISKALKDEEENWARLLKGAPLHEECPMHMDIYVACKSLGYLDDKEVIKVVHLYSEKGEFVEVDLVGLIEGGMWHDLAKRLFNDLCDILRVNGAGDGHGGVWTNEDFPNAWQPWSPTKKLVDWACGMTKGTILKADVQKEILIEAIQRFNEARGAKAVLKQSEGPLKRWERMRRDYDKLVFVAFGHQEVSYSYVMED